MKKKSKVISKEQMAICKLIGEKMRNLNPDSSWTINDSHYLTADIIEALEDNGYISYQYFLGIVSAKEKFIKEFVNTSKIKDYETNE